MIRGLHHTLGHLAQGAGLSSCRPVVGGRLHRNEPLAVVDLVVRVSPFDGPLAADGVVWINAGGIADHYAI